MIYTVGDKSAPKKIKGIVVMSGKDEKVLTHEQALENGAAVGRKILRERKRRLRFLSPMARIFEELDMATDQARLRELDKLKEAERKRMNKLKEASLNCG